MKDNHNHQPKKNQNSTKNSCSCSCMNYNPKYLYKNTSELVNLIEKDFQEIYDEVIIIMKNNVEMMKYDPNDKDLITAVEDNTKIVKNKLFILDSLKFKLKKISPCHPFLGLNLSEDMLDKQVKEDESKGENFENEDDDEDELLIDNVGFISKSNGNMSEKYGERLDNYILDYVNSSNISNLINTTSVKNIKKSDNDKDIISKINEIEL